MTLIELEVADLPPERQKLYRECVARGETPRMALMLATRQAALMGGSDRAFNEGARRKMNNLPFMNRTMHAIARKAGINTEGKYHVAGLGRYDNPLAWVSTIDDVKESLKRQNLSSTGLVKYQAPERPPLPDVPLAPDIVDNEVASRLSQAAQQGVSLPRDPKARASYVAELRDAVVSEHGRPQKRAGRGGSPGERLLKGIAGTRK